MRRRLDAPAGWPYAHAMAAIAPILLFVIAVAAINFFEFHRVD